ncbi:MAG: extracellular solute-binding protein [Anaeromicrobium sp.]|uniref:ABC transporter substrate-binding protein n=1 Tax=Anaeromicrobium sp. TaxID=1929132 RepID=UPI0025CEE6C9|nr:extracellular solute-binding protein [Anaeromicrobium sp.]MCT4595343.1 extracellular solute-binding protein [Anaeromicrobium sp.]
MKKVKLMNLISLLLIMLLVGCGGSKSVGSGEDSQVSSEPVNLKFMINFQSTELITETFEKTIEKFEKDNPDITVELIPGSADYESVMKTKMAANDLPDLWTTHGWSVGRYSEYLMPLTGQEWASRLNPGIEKVITDKNGDVFVLPIDVDLSGIAYNRTVLNKVGVNVDEIKTWDDFILACDKVKAAGYTPIHMGGKDSWTVGNFFDWTAPSFLITKDDDNYRETLKNGSFDWKKWEPIGDLMITFNKKGFFNKDKVSSGYLDSAKNLALDKVAFEFYGNYVISEALKLNPKADLGFMPVPSNDPKDPPTLISGERTAIGVWKDSKHKEEALRFLNYLTKSEIMSELASANGLPAGLVGIESDTKSLKGDYEKYANLRGFPYFDREYLPSGMWDTMCATGTGLLTDEMTSSETAKQMEKDYKRLK